MSHSFRAVPCLGFLVLFGLAALAGCQCNSSPPPSRQPSLDNVVHVSVRPSLLMPGTAVLQIKNTSGKPFGKLTVMFRNDDLRQESAYVTGELKPGETTEVGVLESGWALDTNETIEIGCPGYEGLKFVTYKTDQGMIGIREPWW